MGLKNFILTCEKDNEELRKDVNYYKNMASRLKKENQKLKKQYCERTDCSSRLGTSKKVEALEKENEELKKQVEEWKHHLKCSKEMLDIQAQKGNYDYDEYMLGLYNGMEYIIALFETREPKYINGKEVKFINNQQKEFIKFLEDNWKETQDIWYIKILNKYKEMIGYKDE